MVLPQETTLVLHPDETSAPTEFLAHDFDGDTITYYVPTRGVPGGPSHGSVVVDQSTGTFTYTREAGYTGPDQFKVTVSDAGNGFHLHGLFGFLRPHWGHTFSAVVTLDIVAANDAPVPANDFYTTPESTPFIGDVLSNDTDPDGQTLTAAVVSPPANGDVTMTPNGVFRYSPKPGWSGADLFVYRVSDSMLTANALVAVTVTPVNRQPLTGDDTYSTVEDTAVVGNVLDNDSDPEGDPLTTSLVLPASHGAVEFESNGSFTYTPDVNFAGTDSFSYVASDGSLTSSPTLVTITVAPVNDAPVTTDDGFTITEDTILTGNVLANDIDVDGNPLTASLLSGPLHGVLTLNSDGFFGYVPAPNFTGSDSFSYRVSDGTVTTGPATVTIVVNPVNDAPVASNSSFVVNEDSTLTGSVTVSDVDGDAVSSSVVNGPAHGNLTFNADGSFTYAPAANYAGADSFSYTASDGVATSAPAVVTITVTPVNDAPVARGDAYSMSEDGILTGSVLSNDSDVDSQMLTATVVFAPLHGTLALNPNGSFTYTPAAEYVGVDSFAYAASDGSLTSNTAIVSITIAPVNDTPESVDDIYSIDEDTLLTGDLLANDVDVDGDSLTAQLVDSPMNGALELNADGSFSYTPAADFNGFDWFTYVSYDGVATSAPALVLIIVTPVDDAPIANTDLYTITKDSILAGNVLSNDIDAEGDSLTASLSSDVAHGTLTLGLDGSFTYAPAANYIGSDSFSYVVSDGVNTSPPTAVSIIITGANTPPVVNNDIFTVQEDSALAGNVLTNDTDVDGDTLTAAVSSGPSHGTLALNSDGSFTYTPTANFNGADSFTYTASDGLATSAVATVTISITAVNDTPVAVDNTVTTDEDMVLTGNVLTNDTDIDGDTLTAALVAGPSHGTLALNPDGSFTYTPTANYNGADSFTYTASDSLATSAVATVTISITAVNDTPIAVDDSVSTTEDTVLTGNVLTNDTDIDGDTLTAALVAGPSHGTLTLNPDGSFTYTPDANYNGADAFTYTATDGSATSAVATVSISITAVNDTPLAINDTVTTAEDTQLIGNVLTNDTDIDGDTLTAELVAAASHGTLTLNPDGSFTYTPDANYNGADAFTYTATDGVAVSSIATVSISITAVNDTPLAINDTVTTNEDTQLVGNVLTNDTDIDGDTLTATVASGPSHGTLTLNPDGSFTYTPDTNFNGADAFTYTASDGLAVSSIATVSISITAVDDTPAAVDDSTSTAEDTVLIGNVLTNDTDIDGDTLTAALVAGPSNGTLTLNPDGSFTYTPDANFNGADAFTYTASDGLAVSSIATVSISITAVNDTPAAVNDTVTTAEDTQLVGNVLTNDTDIDGDTLTATVDSGPSHGTLTLNPDGSFTYTPTANYNGADAFTYTATDGSATSAVATVTISITAVNDTPVANNDSVSTTEDTVLTGNVLTNDTDIDGDTLTAELVVGPSHGTLTLNPDGSFTYTPDTDFNGADAFTYTASDGVAVSSIATVSISITAVNDTPLAINDTVTTAEDTQLIGNVLTNDTDIDGDTLTAALVAAASHGTLTLNPDGSFTYTPDANYNGADSFTYTATDGAATSAVATVTITITAVNDTPAAVNDSVTTTEDTVLTGNVLTNDTDIDGDTLTAALVAGPSHGTLTLNPDGSFTYTPDANYNGADAFTYTASDGLATSAVATVTISITAVNDTPLAINDTVTTNEDTQLIGNVLTNDTDIDGDTLTAELVAGPSHGTLTLNPDGSFTYTPDTDFNGADSFTYTATDSLAVSNIATVSITITAVNDTPVAVDDSTSTAEDTVLTGNVLTNDTDIDGDPLTAELVAGPSHGTLTLNPDGSFTYTPTANYNGADSFTYTATDSLATSAVATVSISITAVNDTPAAVNDTVTTAEDTQLVGNVLTNDTDIDGDPLTAELVAGPSHGTLTLNPDGSFTYTPTANYNGADAFTYTATDGLATSAVATVTINITAVNDTPLAVNDTVTTAEDTQLVGNVLTNDTDIDGDTLTATVDSGPSHGTLTLNPDGSFTYTPTANYSGADSFTYTASDGVAVSSIATVSISITAVNDAPVANNDTFTIDEDSSLANTVKSNDTDAEGDSITVALVAGPSHGALTLNPDGSFTYTPDADFNGADSFTYTATDGAATSAVATVTITITAVNDSPVATDDTFTIDEDFILSAGVLSNDVDIDGDTLTAILVDGPNHGDLTFNADGSFTYTPEANYNGDDSFTYTASDGLFVSNTATVAIVITAVNDTPVANNDSYTIAEDSNLSANVVTNDSDIDGDAITAALLTGPSHGALTLNPDGSFFYTPTTNFNGVDSFTYSVSDGSATSNTALVTIAVTAVNDAPVANDDTGATTEDTVLTGNVLTNDTDIDGDTLTATLVSGPSHGAVSINADGTYTYTPAVDYNGSDSFTYLVSDGSATDTGLVTISITAVNDSPVANTDTYSIGEDSILAGNVLSNDVDADGDTLTAALVTGPSHGTLSLSGNGTFTYTPDANYNGADSFTYTASDGSAVSNTAIVAITVTSVNDAPVATNDTFTINEDTQLIGNVLGNDTDAEGSALTASVVTGPSHGTLTLNGNGSFTYTPTANYNGADTFTYTASDGTATSNTATVSITINAVNDAPVAVNNSFTTAEDTQLTGNVLTNDTDVDGNTLTATVVTGPSHGTLTLNSNGSFTYTPTANYNGTDVFTYKANDGTVNSNTAIVTITITPVNDAPVANNDTYTTNEDTALNGNVISNDTDVDGNTLTATVVTGPTHGTLTLNGNGSFTYTPTANYNGADTFTYTASDGTATSGTATVSITVIAVNDAPVAVNDSYTTNEDTALTVSAAGVLANDTDVDGNTLTATVVTGPSHGTLTLNGNGSFTYTPTANYNGADTFTYTASDGTASSNTATVTVTVTAVNDAPVATSDTYSTNQDVALNGNVLSNDTDVDGNTLTATVVTGPTHGTLTLNSNGSFTYTPTASYNGTDSFTYTASDGIATSATTTVSITVVDNVAPTAVGVQTTNGGGTNGLMQQGDTIVYTFSEPIDPGSILSGWTGSSTNVVVRAYDGNILLGLLGGNDTLQIFDATNTSLLPLGTVELGRTDYVTGLVGGTITFGATGTPSTMTMSGNTITIVLGTYDSVFLGAVRNTAGGTGTMVWTPSTTPYDLAGNTLSAGAATESGTVDRDF
ncbi:tandem-95 repeat protein [Mycolicibacterium sp. 3033]|nr:tandem-95 repeat protein [Mycolicibacterium aurantiacum]